VRLSSFKKSHFKRKKEEEDRSFSRLLHTELHWFDTYKLGAS